MGPRGEHDGSTVGGMAVSKFSVSIPDWLDPIIREAAETNGMSVSGWLVEAAKTVLTEREAAARRRWEAGHGIDRRAQLDAADAEFAADRARKAGQAQGAA